MAYDQLKLENQLCFPLYACAKEVVKQYTPFLETLGLTYTQYIVMLALWEYREMNVKTLGLKLFLDSGTLTPLLKKLEQQSYITRERMASDERVVMLKLTPFGEALEEKAKTIPEQMRQCMPLTSEEAATLYQLLYKVLGSWKD